MNRKVVSSVFIALACAMVAACGSNAAPPPPAASPAHRNAAASASAAASAVASAAAVGFNEADFTTSDRNRDPFRAYPEIFTTSTPGGPDNHRTVAVAADRFSLDELKLVALVTGNSAPKAMFVDPDGKGWIVTLGQLIGRSELVKAGGTNSAEYDLNWRVDRIREGDVVFVRENPGRANIPTATRVVALRPEGDVNSRVRLVHALRRFRFRFVFTCPRSRRGVSSRAHHTRSKDHFYP